MPKWRANPDLVRKHFMRTRGRQAGRRGLPVEVDEAAEAAHGPEWRASVKARTGSEPRCQYFDLLILLDNEKGEVTEYP